MITDLEEAVPADVIAAIAGVGFSDVRRVLLAMNYIEVFTNIDANKMLNALALPESASFERGAAEMHAGTADRDISDDSLRALAEKIAHDDPKMYKTLRLHRFKD